MRRAQFGRVLGLEVMPAKARVFRTRCFVQERPGQEGFPSDLLPITGISLMTYGVGREE